MSAKLSPYPEGASWVSPYIIVFDVDQTADFYEKAFDMQKIHLVPGEDGSTWHAEMRYKNQLIMLGKATAYGGKTKPPRLSGVESPINLYLYCEDVDDLFDNAVSHGAKALAEPENMFWGDRMCRLEDPEGYVWCFATYLGQE